jgi:3-oxoacyl-[acyl-carrier protein] reductase
MIEPGLKGKVVMVTGANHGIGAATAGAFAGQGATVFLTCLRMPFDEDRADEGINEPGYALYRSNRSKSADHVVDAIREQGGRAESWECDLSEPSVISQLCTSAGS